MPGQAAGTMARELWLLRAACFCQVFAFGIQWTFGWVWMRDQGLGEAAIGAVASTSISTSLAAGLVWGRLADHSGRPDRIVLGGCLLLAAALFYLSQCRHVAQFVVYGVAAGLALPMVSTLMPLLAVSALGSRGRGRGYASYRVFGSLGYIVATLLMPRLADGTQPLFWIASLALLGAVVPLSLLRVHVPPRRRRGRALEVLRQGELSAFLVAIFFFALAVPAVFTFTTVYARRLGADASFIGLLAALQGFVALFALPLVGLAVDRYGTRPLLVVALAALPLRALSLSLVARYEWLLLPQVFHFFTWAGLEVAGVLFVAGLASEGGRATAQALYAGSQVMGSLLGASLAGYLAEYHGYPTMYRVSGALAAVGFGIFAAVQVRRARTASDHHAHHAADNAGNAGAQAPDSAGG